MLCKGKVSLRVQMLKLECVTSRRSYDRWFPGDVPWDFVDSITHEHSRPKILLPLGLWIALLSDHNYFSFLSSSALLWQIPTMSLGLDLRISSFEGCPKYPMPPFLVTGLGSLLWISITPWASSFAMPHMKFITVHILQTRTRIWLSCQHSTPSS